MEYDTHFALDEAHDFRVLCALGDFFLDARKTLYRLLLPVSCPAVWTYLTRVGLLSGLL